MLSDEVIEGSCFFLFSISFVTGKGSSNGHKPSVGIATSLERDNFEF